jgi:hypothetical protein
MAQVTLCYNNLFEAGLTVVVTNESASFPKYRCYDRDIGKLFKGSSAGAGTFSVRVDLGATATANASRVVIPAGHNLSGLPCKIQSCANDFSSGIVDMASWTPTPLQQVQVWTAPSVTRYWRLLITNGATIPEIPEIFLGLDVVMTFNPEFGGPLSKKRNIVRKESPAGKAYKIKLGEARKQYHYNFKAIEDAQKIYLQSWEDACEGSQKNFYLIDSAGIVIFVELQNELNFTPAAYGLWDVSMDLLEVI